MLTLLRRFSVWLCGHTSLIDTIYLRAEESPIDDDAMPSHIPICTSLLTADVVVVVVSHVFGTMQQQHKYWWQRQWERCQQQQQQHQYTAYRLPYNINDKTDDATAATTTRYERNGVIRLVDERRRRRRRTISFHSSCLLCDFSTKDKYTTQEMNEPDLSWLF